MGLLGTKRIARDGGGILENPYASNFVTATDPRYAAAQGTGVSEQYGAVNPYDYWLSAAPGLTDSYWRNLGYTGPVSTQATDNTDAQMAPELQQWIASRGLQTATDGGLGWNALADSSGKYVSGSEYGNRTNDDAAYIATSIGLALPSLWANAAASGGDAVSGMDLAADGGNNALWQTGAPQVAEMPAAQAQNPYDAYQMPEAPPADTSPYSAYQDPTTATAQVEQPAFKPSDNYGPGMTGGQTSAYDTVIDATGSPALANSASDASTAFDSLKNWGGSISDWAKANPTLSKILTSGAIYAATKSGGGGGGGGGGAPASNYTDTGYRPNINRGNWSASVTPTYSKPQQQQTTGLLGIPTTGQQNDGLWRFGLLGK